MTDFLSTFPDFDSYDRHISDIFGHSSVSNNRSNDDIHIEEARVPEIKPRKRKKESDDEDYEVNGTISKKKKPDNIPNHVDEEMQEIDDLCTNGTKLTTVDPEEWRNYIGPSSSTTRNIQIIFRLPNNEKAKIELPATTSIKALFVFLNGRGLNSQDHVLILSYPRREYTFDGYQSQTLQQLGFNNQEVIHVDHK